MSDRKSRQTSQVAPPIQPFPLDRESWNEVVAQLNFSPQQAQIVELIICGACDKQIALHLCLSVDTVRTYLKRISARLDARGRVEIVVKVLVTALEMANRDQCHRKR